MAFLVGGLQTHRVDGAPTVFHALTVAPGERLAGVGQAYGMARPRVGALGGGEVHSRPYPIGRSGSARFLFGVLRHLSPDTLYHSLHYRNV